MLVKEIISEVRQNIRAVSQDMWVSSKYIHNKLKGYAALFIKREADDKRLYKYSNLWTTIDCIELEEVDLINCCDVYIPNCSTVMKSKKKLPELYSTRFGYLLNISSVDYSKDYLQTTPQQYKYTKSREFVDKSKRYFWIDNGHIIVPDVMVEKLRVRGMFQNKADAVRLNCAADSDSACTNLLDQEFVAPEHLIQDIKKATTADIVSSLRAIQPDEMPNNNESEKTNPTKI